MNTLLRAARTKVMPWSLESANIKTHCRVAKEEDKAEQTRVLSINISIAVYT